MCCCSPENVCDLVKEKRRTCRKARWCQECGAPVGVGDRYLHVDTLFDGEWDHMAFCALCGDRMDEWNRLRAGFFCFTDLRNWHCNVQCRPYVGGAFSRFAPHDPRELELRRDCEQWGTRMGLLVKWIFEDHERKERAA